MIDNRIKFRHLQTFVEVSRQKSVMKAAELLHVSQPAVTKTIRELEEVLGVSVFERDGRGIRITRYGEAHAPMDETLTRCVLDISGRPHCVYKSSFSQPRLGEMDTEMFPHWFHSFAQTAGITLHIETLYGENNHHIAESMYKALARALRQAVKREGADLPSTKGAL